VQEDREDHGVRGPAVQVSHQLPEGHPGGERLDVLEGQLLAEAKRSQLRLPPK